MEFDPSKLTPIHQTDRYSARLKKLRDKKIDTSCIEQAVEGAVQNISQDKSRSFVVYGEPQSGKTEMMIALTARLLDAGHQIIIHLLNDSLQLLEQNLDRFQRSGLSPSPCNFSEILDPAIEIGKEERIIFCKKNASDLQKLIDKINHIGKKIIIDDEADYATPNAKVNKGTKTRINHLIETLLKKEGVYIGVTATPARLDLNNTFQNDHEMWVDFPPHKRYSGQDVFFPLAPDEPLKFSLNTLSDTGDDPKLCREALFRFLVNVAHLNLHPEINDGIKHYSFLVHTSGKKIDHKSDYQAIQKVFGVLSNKSHKDYIRYIKQVGDIAAQKYPGEEYDIANYILQNIGCKNIVVMNSDKQGEIKNYKSATDPSSLFTIVIGGNIVSRGVTFDNLLSMYFTRDVKHKLQQDTYIQRARMFGSRGDYLPYFELTIPAALYQDWHRCFVFHRLSLAAIRNGNGAPVWLEDGRTAATAASSVDKANVSLDSGEMSFGILNYGDVADAVTNILQSSKNNYEKLESLHTLLGEQHLPKFLLSYVAGFLPNGDASIMIHQPASIEGSKDADQINISRKKGFMGGASFTKHKDVPHHFQILFNEQKKARLFYKYSGKITFLKNQKLSPIKYAA